MKLSGLKFTELPKLEDLNPGVKALGFKVLVLCRQIDNEIGIKGLDGKSLVVAKTSDGHVSREEEAGSEGMVVTLGLMAGHERWNEGDISPGDVILFARYSAKATEFEGEDGRTYRIMNDEDIIGVRINATTKIGAKAKAVKAA